MQFVRTLSAIAQEELKPVHSPRVFSLTKIVEISHFNMTRIRSVALKGWAVGRRERGFGGQPGPSI